MIDSDSLPHNKENIEFLFLCARYILSEYYAQGVSMMVGWAEWS